MTMLRAALLLFTLLLTSGASAQRRTPPPQPQPAPQPAPASVDGAEDDDMDTSASGARSHDVVQGGQRVRVFQFSGLDIAGRLRSPQLLYFLGRLRAEFDRPRLPHRSFMPELERSTRSSAF